MAFQWRTEIRNKRKYNYHSWYSKAGFLDLTKSVSKKRFDHNYIDRNTYPGCRDGTMCKIVHLEIDDLGN